MSCSIPAYTLNFVPGLLPKEPVIGKEPHCSATSPIPGPGGMGPEHGIAEGSSPLLQINGRDSTVEEQRPIDV